MVQSLWMLRCLPWLTQPLSLLSLWTPSSLEFLILEFQLLYSRLPFTLLSFKVSYDNKSIIARFILLLLSFLGIFYLIVPVGTLIDWWIITRETIFILIYLCVMTYCLYGNEVGLGQALILFLLYIIHIFLMKYSNKYEVAIKQSVAISMERRELSKIANTSV